jgi:uncharacterized protein YoxC
MADILSNPVALLLIALALFVLGVVVTRWFSQHGPTAAERKIEAGGFEALTRALQALADTSDEDAAINAATQRKQMKAAQMDHAREVLSTLGKQ